MIDRIARIMMLTASLIALGALSAEAQVPAPPRQLPPCTQVGQQVTLSLNTGTAGTIPPTADPFWHVVQPTPTTPFTTTPVSPGLLWLPNSATNPKWIQPAPNGSPQNFPVNTYVYSTQFTTPVDPYLYTSITITGGFAADDTAIVKLNAIQIAACPGGVHAGDLVLSFT